MRLIVYLLFSFCICTKIAEFSTTQVVEEVQNLTADEINQVGLLADGETALTSILTHPDLDGELTRDLIISLLHRGANPFYIQDDGVSSLESILVHRKMRPHVGWLLAEIFSVRDPHTEIGKYDIENLLYHCTFAALGNMSNTLLYRIVLRAKKQWWAKKALLLCMKELDEEYPGLGDVMKTVMKWQYQLHHTELLELLK